LNGKMKRQFGRQGDPNFYTKIIRAHELAERQTVSLLEIPGIGRGTLKALWRGGITTADQFAAASTGKLAEVLSTRMPIYRNRERTQPTIKAWQNEIIRLRNARPPAPDWTARSRTKSPDIATTRAQIEKWLADDNN